MNSRYQPGGATFPSGGDCAVTLVAPPPVISQPMKRCDILKPCVTAPGRISTTSVIAGAFGVSIVNVAP
jgi:hypothetical protein